MKEIWKDIPGYNGRYRVSSFGAIKSSSSGKWKRMHPSKNRWGYLHLLLSKDGVSKTVCVHRVVADAFIQNQDNKEQVNHIDGDKENNTVSNLEWVTELENHHHSVMVLGQDNPKPVVCEETGETFFSLREAERKTGIDHSSISDCCKGIAKSAGKKHWRFI